MELSEDKDMCTQGQLAQVIQVAERMALERDTVYRVARDQQEASKVTVTRMHQGGVTLGRLEEKLKLYKMRATAKMSTVADRWGGGIPTPLVGAKKKNMP